MLAIKYALLQGIRHRVQASVRLEKLAGFIDAIKSANINTNHFLKSEGRIKFISIS